MEKKVFNAANKYLADVAISYIKLHNLHWNVVGSQFKAVHEYLESLYESYADILDEVAELIKMNGEFPVASFKEYSTLSDIAELKSKDYKTEDTVKALLENLKKLKEDALLVRKEADVADAFDFVNTMEDHIASYNKNIWFVESMLK
ncbi:MAG: DNA starvation/stationary phase protection protein [Treponema sp.]|nr:DNA starvation/stationary phase protection protein [Treponema sp.]